MIGTKVLLRVRMAARDAYAGERVDGTRLLGLFGDLAAELLIRLDGDEGLFHTYESVEFLASVFAGDYVEATAEIVDVGDTARRIRFEARKVISNVRRPDVPPSAADVLREPVVVCRATGTAVTPAAMQRRPRELYVPQLPAGARPTPDAVVTPPADDGSALARPQTDLILMASIFGGAPTARPTREVVEEAERCREAGASVIRIRAPTGDKLSEYVSRVREATDCIVHISPPLGGPASASPASRAAELVTLPCGSTNLGDAVTVVTRPTIHELAGAAARTGTALMLECREVGHVEQALALVEEGTVRGPLRFELVLGAPGSMRATDANLRFLTGLLPITASWTLATAGRQAQQLTESALRMGGHVRLGDADADADDASTSGLVARAATYAKTIGRTPVDPARARTILGTGASPRSAS